jgi:hypothetical protein
MTAKRERLSAQDADAISTNNKKIKKGWRGQKINSLFYSTLVVSVNII